VAGGHPIKAEFRENLYLSVPERVRVIRFICQYLEPWQGIHLVTMPSPEQRRAWTRQDRASNEWQWLAGGRESLTIWRR